MATTENSCLYKVICFIVVWIDTIARNYLRIKAMCDAVMQVAQSTQPYRPHTSSLRPQQQRRQQRQVCYINQLPTELIKVILEMNGATTDWFHCTRVCQRWHQLVTPLLWKVPILPSLPLHHSRTIPRFLRSLAKYGNAVESLRLTRPWLTDDTLRSILHHCPHLTSLELKGAGLTTSGYQYLARAQCTPHLTRLVITDESLDDESLVVLAMRCTQTMTHLELAHSKRITHQGIRAIVAATRPSTLVIKDCFQVSGKLLQEIAPLCRSHLVGLELARIGTILHSDLDVFTQSCPHLHHLSLSFHRSPLIGQLLHKVRVQQDRKAYRTLSRSKSSMPFYTASSTTDLLIQQRVQDTHSYSCPHDEQVSPATVEMILDRLDQLDHLDLSHWPGLTDPLLRRLRQKKEASAL